MITAAEAIAKLEQFHPEGILVVSHKNESGERDEASIVTGVAYQNVETYGLYDENGVDLSEGKNNSDFVGLPWNLTGEIVIKEPNKKYSKGEDLSKYRGHGNSSLSGPTKIKDAIKMLKERKPDAVLIGFNWCEIVDIRPFDTSTKIVTIGWGQTGGYSDTNFTEGVNPMTIAECVGGRQFETNFDPERIQRREASGMNSPKVSLFKRNEKTSYVMKFEEFIKESKKNESVILDILKKTDKPILASTVLKKWLNGAPADGDNVFEFYEELAGLGKKIKEERDGTKVYLSLAK